MSTRSSQETIPTEESNDIQSSNINSERPQDAPLSEDSKNTVPLREHAGFCENIESRNEDSKSTVPMREQAEVSDNLDNGIPVDTTEELDEEFLQSHPYFKRTLEGGQISDFVDMIYRRYTKKLQKPMFSKSLSQELKELLSEEESPLLNSIQCSTGEVPRFKESTSETMFHDESDPSPTQLWTFNDRAKFLLFLSWVLYLSFKPDTFSYVLTDFYQYISQKPNFCPHFSFVFLPIVFGCGIYHLCDKIQMIIDEAAEEGRRTFGR